MTGFVTLRITGQGLILQEITDKLGRYPDYSYKKGDVYTSKRSGRRIVYKEDAWLSEVKNKEGESLENCIEQFVLSFCYVADYLKALATKFDVCIWISAFSESEQSNVHLSEHTIVALCAIGASVDVNVMFLEDFYNGTYREKEAPK